MTNLSVQLYSLRAELEVDLDQTLAALAGTGLTQVEPFDIVNHPNLPEALRRHGLTAPTAHASLLGDDLGPALDAAEALGVRTLFQPYYDPAEWESRASIDKLTSQLADAAAAAAERGIAVGYHNHDFELRAHIDGAPAYDYFVQTLDPSVVLEVDTFWAAFAGADVDALLKHLGAKAVALHVKDGALGGELRPNVALGQGDMDVASIVAASPEGLLVVELDSCETDMLTAVTESVAYLQGLEHG